MLCLNITCIYTIHVYMYCKFIKYMQYNIMYTIHVTCICRGDIPSLIRCPKLWHLYIGAVSRKESIGGPMGGKTEEHVWICFKYFLSWISWIWDLQIKWHHESALCPPQPVAQCSSISCTIHKLHMWWSIAKDALLGQRSSLRLGNWNTNISKHREALSIRIAFAVSGKSLSTQGRLL